MGPSRFNSRRAFSLIEMAMVFAIMGLVAAIAIPHMGSAADTVRAAAVKGSVTRLQDAVELYAAEHADRGPELDPDGTVTSTPVSLALRLLRPTDDLGNVVDPGGLYGPYLRTWPTNPYNGKKAIRIDGPPAGVNAAGWRIDSTTRTVQADHLASQVSNGPAGGVAVSEDSDDPSRW
jgi:prepilin-type N-terminal cleavage/methylation domain-containing protein